MGPSKSKQEDANTEFVNHPKFQEVRIVGRDADKQIQLQVPVHAEREFRDWEKSQKNLDDYNKENLLLPLSFEFQKEGLCGSTGIVKIFYENYPYLLTDEITNRRSLNKLFDESEIWYLLYTAVSAAKDFQKHKAKLGDIRPQNIFINEDGQVKLANVYSWPNEETNFMKTVLGNDPTYLAPEEVRELQNGKHESTCDPSIAEAFSIGLTIIDAGLLGDFPDLYNFKNQKFDEVKAKELFHDWSNTQYSDFLKRTVLSLVELDPKNRSTPAAVYNKLQPYEEDIKNLKEFASSVSGSPNRPALGAIQHGYPYHPIPYQYEGPAMVKSQLVADQPTSYIPAQKTTYTGPYSETTQLQTTYITNPPNSYTGPSGTVYTAGSAIPKSYLPGNISSGIATLNPAPYHASAASAPIPYQFQYQPSTVGVGASGPSSNLPTSINTRSYEFTSSIQGGTTYGTSIPSSVGYPTGVSSYNSPPLTTFLTGSGAGQTTSGPTYGNVVSYTQSYYPGQQIGTDVNRPAFTTAQQSTSEVSQKVTFAPTSGTGLPSGQSTQPQQASSSSKFATITTSNVVPADTSNLRQEFPTPTTTLNRIVSGQQQASNDVTRVESTEQETANSVRKDLNDARQVTSIQPPRQF